MTSTTFNEKSSFTADGVAYRRTFTDLPYAKEIFEILKAIRGPIDISSMEQTAPYRTAPMFESRYILTDRELEKSGVKQILELAGGLSSRGFVMAMKPDVIYVELDLPEKSALKTEVLERLAIKLNTRVPSNLYLEKGNVIDEKAFKKACRLFNSGPIAVICEGLLRYMDREDQQKLSLHIYSLLKKHGGLWITPDIERLSDVEKTPGMSARYDRWIKQAGIDIRKNIFKDDADAVSSFENLGFKVTKYSQLEVIDKLTSPTKLGLTREEVNEYLKHRDTFVMRV